MRNGFLSISCLLYKPDCLNHLLNDKKLLLIMIYTWIWNPIFSAKPTVTIANLYNGKINLFSCWYWALHLYTGLHKQHISQCYGKRSRILSITSLVRSISIRNDKAQCQLWTLHVDERSTISTNQPPPSLKEAVSMFKSLSHLEKVNWSALIGVDVMKTE